MQNKKKIRKKFSNLIFDLDGVLLDSRKNMLQSWNLTKKKFKIKESFSSYVKFIGLPFLEILKKLNIKKNQNEIKLFYKNISYRNSNTLKLYPFVYKILVELKKKNLKYFVVTSKDSYRTKKIIKQFNLQPTSIHCPKKKLKGKPFPDQILECISANNLNVESSCYVGDTIFDYRAAKAAKVNFIYAKYGFGNNKKVYPNIIKNFKDLKNYI